MDGSGELQRCTSAAIGEHEHVGTSIDEVAVAERIEQSRSITESAASSVSSILTVSMSIDDKRSRR